MTTFALEKPRKQRSKPVAPAQPCACGHDRPADVGPEACPVTDAVYERVVLFTVEANEAMEAYEQAVGDCRCDTCAIIRSIHYTVALYTSDLTFNDTGREMTEAIVRRLYRDQPDILGLLLNRMAQRD